MTNTATETRTVVVEREMPHPPEKIWRALTQPHLIEEWLMKNDFQAASHLLWIQSIQVTHPGTKEALRAAADRLNQRRRALVHDVDEHPSASR